MPTKLLCRLYRYMSRLKLAVKGVDISQNTLQFISFSHIANYAHVCMLHGCVRAST